MFRYIVSASAALMLAGCATVSHAPPAIEARGKPGDAGRKSYVELLKGVVGMSDATNLVSWRKDDYDRGADQIANGSQLFDLPILGSAISGLNTAAWGGPDSNAKRAAIFAGSMLGVRSYYAPAARHDVYLAAAQALGCVRRVGLDLSRLDVPQTIEVRGKGGTTSTIDGNALNPAWREAYEWASTDDPSAPLAADFRRLAPIVLRAPMTLAHSIDDVDTIARKRLMRREPPDLSAFAAGYRASLISVQDQVVQNDAAQETASGLTSRRKMGGNALAAGEAKAASFAYLLEDQGLLDAISGMDAQLAACRAMMG